MSKIAIIGAAPSSRMNAPYTDPLWTVWAHSPSIHTIIPRFDAWFEMHSWRRLIKGRNNGRGPYLEWLKKQPLVYVQEPNTEFPNVSIYPKEEIFKEFYPFSKYFFTCTAAWMLALAIQQKPEAIGLWGIDMIQEQEYRDERPGVLFFMAEAQRRGIEVLTPPESAINWTQPPYGYRENIPSYIRMKARREELEQRIAGENQVLQDAQYRKQILSGALEDVQILMGSMWNQEIE